MARRLLRSLFAAVIVLLALVCTRSAMAYAPFCDVSASSEDAPPPLMPVADIRFEADHDVFIWTWCRGAMGEAVTEARSHTSGQGLSTVDAAQSVEFGVLIASVTTPDPCGVARIGIEHRREPGRSGFPPSVYRPPR